MQTDRCEPLFAPRSIAVVGVSGRAGLSWGRITVQRLLAGGYGGEVVAVARGPVELAGVRAVRSLGEIGYGPDLVVVATPAATVPGVLREAREAGAGAAVVYAAGFAEAGGHELEAELRAAAGELAVLGPNCLGLVGRRAAVRLSPTAMLDREQAPPGPVAVVSHSGALGFVLLDMLERAGVGYCYYASTGNEACLGAAEVGRYLLARPEVEVLVLYLEAVRDAAGLRELGRLARRSGKAVVALAAGRSEAGRRAALSHTAAVAGDRLLLASLCRQEGITLAADDDQLVDAVLCARRGVTLPPSPRLAILTMSGGAGGVLADNLTALGARIPALSDATRRGLAEVGGVEATDANPVDLGGNVGHWVDRLQALLGVLDADPEVDGVVLYLTFGDRFLDAYRRVAERASAARTPTWFVWTCAPAGERERLGRPDTVLDGIGSLTRRLSVLLPDTVPPRPRPARPRVPGRTVWTELRAAPLLADAGIAHVPTVSAADAEDLTAAVRDRGWPGPFVVKGDAADVPHRARLGLVRLDVTAAELPAAAEAVAGRLATASTDPGRRLVAQPLLDHCAELALGAVRDPIYGTAVLLGAGGDRAEDGAAPRRGLLLPAADGQVRELASWAATVLAAPADATAGVLEALAGLLADHPEITEVDVNPLCVVGDRLVAVDALITVTEEGTP
ncbi:acetate--CoA ligase family protein [Pseudonocardia acaciae]|uniref:acetate--CoA ligase family protein n=1 Tax=Pseudonocardia acaciae TaxID=551276 RepID=UPI00048D4656|nr:acetate--CoA ligase family protein [Pseudonocardia acaciae]